MMRMSALIFFAACAVLPASGCSEGGDNPGTQNVADWGTLNTSDAGVGRIVPRTGRSAQRLSVDQLRRSVESLFDGIHWLVGKRDGFEVFSSTLGEADYIDTTQDSREVSSLFMKFIDDMAGNVCGQAIARDLTLLDTSSTSFVRFPKDVERSLRFALLKFHAIAASPDDRQAVAPLRTLFDAALKETESSAQAWEAVCFAVLTAPEFLTY